MSVYAWGRIINIRINIRNNVMLILHIWYLHPPKEKTILLCQNINTSIPILYFQWWGAGMRVRIWFWGLWLVSCHLSALSLVNIGWLLVHWSFLVESILPIWDNHFFCMMMLTVNIVTISCVGSMMNMNTYNSKNQSKNFIWVQLTNKICGSNSKWTWYWFATVNCHQSG